MFNLEQELRRHFKGIRFPGYLSEKLYPGKVIHPQKEQVIPHIRDYLRSLPPEKWHLDKMISLNLIYGKKIAGSMRLSPPFSMLGVLTVHPVQGSVREIDIEYEISEIFATEFSHISELELKYELNKLRYINRSLFRELKSRILITQSYYARSFVITQKKNKSHLKGIFTDEFIQVDPIVRHIMNDDSITVVSNENFPFAVSGILIK